VIGWCLAGFAALAAILAISPGMPWPTAPLTPRSAVPDIDRVDRLHSLRWLWCLLAGAGAATFVSGPWAIWFGVASAVAVWWWIGRSEPASVRRRREAAARDLPALVHLLAGALESGCAVAEALSMVCAALPGPASDLLAGVPARLALGMAGELAWRPVLDDPTTSPVGRAMLRVHRSGASVAEEIARLADDLDQRARLQVEERARAVGVKAALPMGLCLLPSFVLIGVVPLVAGLLRSLAL
jgi:Flp pilus assembly protein TadB